MQEQWAGVTGKDGEDSRMKGGWDRSHGNPGDSVISPRSPPSLEEDCKNMHPLRQGGKEPEFSWATTQPDMGQALPQTAIWVPGPPRAQLPIAVHPLITQWELKCTSGPEITASSEADCLRKLPVSASPGRRESGSILIPPPSLHLPTAGTHSWTQSPLPSIQGLKSYLVSSGCRNRAPQPGRFRQQMLLYLGLRVGDQGVHRVGFWWERLPGIQWATQRSPCTIPGLFSTQGKFKSSMTRYLDTHTSAHRLHRGRYHYTHTYTHVHAHMNHSSFF